MNSLPYHRYLDAEVYNLMTVPRRNPSPWSQLRRRAKAPSKLGSWRSKHLEKLFKYQCRTMDGR